MSLCDSQSPSTSQSGRADRRGRQPDQRYILYKQKLDTNRPAFKVVTLDNFKSYLEKEMINDGLEVPNADAGFVGNQNNPEYHVNDGDNDETMMDMDLIIDIPSQILKNYPKITFTYQRSATDRSHDWSKADGSPISGLAVHRVPSSLAPLSSRMVKMRSLIMFIMTLYNSESILTFARLR